MTSPICWQKIEGLAGNRLIAGKAFILLGGCGLEPQSGEERVKKGTSIRLLEK
jgi:hypothetical protein